MDNKPHSDLALLRPEFEGGAACYPDLRIFVCETHLTADWDPDPNMTELERVRRRVREADRLCDAEQQFIALHFGGRPVDLSPCWTGDGKFFEVCLGGDPDGAIRFRELAIVAGACLPEQMLAECWPECAQDELSSALRDLFWVRYMFSIAWQEKAGVLTASKSVGEPFGPFGFVSMLHINPFLASVVVIDRLRIPVTEQLADTERDTLQGRATRPVQDGRKSTNDTRDKWLYGQVCQFVPYKAIVSKLKRKPQSWSPLSTPQAVVAAVKRYCKRENLKDPTPRKAGRPPRRK